MSVTTRLYHAEHAWLGYARPSSDVLIKVDAGGRFAGITPGVTTVPPEATRLSGLALPGLSNVHSHVFHRALRGRTHAGRGSFWTWREQMYAVADRLDPDSYRTLAAAVYAEMAMAGVTSVGEFHYLHHGRDGKPYDDPNAMGEALIEAAADAGIRITLLDTLYLTSDVDGAALTGVQQRFGDGSVDQWLERTAALRDRPHARIGAAAHSVRAVPEHALRAVAAHKSGPLHVHLSEQPAENEACQAHYGCSPTELLHRTGLLRPDTTVVHATHVSDHDIGLLAGGGVSICLCPSTERDLADGLVPAGPLVDAGSAVCVGTDSHAIIDMFEEARLVELHERLRTGERGNFGPAELLHLLDSAGHGSLGWPDLGTITVGARADLVTVRLDSLRTVGVEPTQVMFAATAADVNDVIVQGEYVVRDGHHRSIDVPRALRDAIAQVQP